MRRFAQLFSRKNPRSTSGPENATLSERDAIALARSLLNEDDPQQALGVLQAAHATHPASPDVAELLQRVQRMVNPALLEAALDQLESEPGPELRGMIAELYRQIGNAPAALQYGAEAIHADPIHAIGYQTVGRVHLEEFRTSGDTIAGMNALRYVAKAHSLTPRDSHNLLQLAEIFTLLRAPDAGRRFLTPVQQAFPDHPRVRDLDQRLTGLAPEGTSQIQELFLRYEREVLGDTSTCQDGVELPETLVQEIVEEAFAQAGTEGFFLVDGTRRLLGGRHLAGWDTTELGNTFGLLIETTHLNCGRMSLGALDWLAVQQPGGLVVLAQIADGLSAVYVGAVSVRQPAVLQLVERVRERVVGVSGRNR